MSTPISISEEIKNYNTESLIEFLRGQEHLQLKDAHFNILREQKIEGRAFLNITKDGYLSWGLKEGPATVLVNFAKECKEQMKRSFSSYKDLRSVFKKFGIDYNSLADIPQFSPPSFSLSNDDEELRECIKDIKLKLGNMGTVVFDSNEAVRCEYISTILHAAINIARRITKKELTLIPQFEINGEENTGRRDYSIKALEELIHVTEGKQYAINVGFVQNVMKCESAFQANKRKRKADIAFGEEFDYLYGIITTATEWYFLLYSSDGISCTSKNPLYIRLSEAALTENSEEDLKLCKNVKRILEIVVGLLKGRMDVEKSPSKKRQRIQELFIKE
jgi:hypothetical protein